MKKYFCIFVVLILLFILIYSANFYFLSRLSSSIGNGRLKGSVDSSKVQTGTAVDELDASNLKSIYKNKNPRFDQIKNKIIRNFAPCGGDGRNYSEIWNEANAVSSIKLTRSVVKEFSLLVGSSERSLPAIRLVDVQSTQSASGSADRRRFERPQGHSAQAELTHRRQSNGFLQAGLVHEESSYRRPGVLRQGSTQLGDCRLLHWSFTKPKMDASSRGPDDEPQRDLENR